MMRERRRPSTAAHKTGAEIAGRKALMKLLRLALAGPLEVRGESEGRTTLCAADGAESRHGAALIAAALARGLLLRAGGSLAAGPEARAFVRRAMADGEPDERFLAQHREEVVEQIVHDGIRQPARRNLAESPLAVVARLKEKSGAAFLSPEAIEAGERLAADFERGGLQPRVTASWEPRLSTKTAGQAAGADLSDSAMAARRRLGEAIDAMGPELSGVALDVCCFAKGLETVERERLWPARSAKLMLRAALLALARHYRPQPARRPGTRHWGTQDFRPLL